VVVIIQDPITKKTALAHFDRFTTPQSLSKDVIEKFPAGTKLNAYLVGARDQNPGENNIAISNSNIEKVNKELLKYNYINIIADDRGAKGAPAGIIFDPQTSKLEDAIPGKPDKTVGIRNMALIGLIHDAPIPDTALHKAFDLTQSDVKHIPPLKDEQLKQIIVNLGPNLYPQYSGFTREGVRMGPDELWNANVKSNPNIDAVEYIKEHNPELYKTTYEESLNQFVDGLPHIEDKLSLKATLSKEHEKFLQDPEISVAQMIKETNQIKEKFVTKPPEKKLGLIKRLGNNIRNVERMASKIIATPKKYFQDKAAEKKLQQTTPAASIEKTIDPSVTKEVQATQATQAPVTKEVQGYEIIDDYFTQAQVTKEVQATQATQAPVTKEAQAAQAAKAVQAKATQTKAAGQSIRKALEDCKATRTCGNSNSPSPSPHLQPNATQGR